MYGMSIRTTQIAPAARGTARDAILGAALRVIAEEGVDAVTHRRVAERAGVSLGSMTHHFSGRDELLRETFRRYVRDVDESFGALQQGAEGRHGDPIETVRTVLVALVEREFADPSLVRAEYELILFASKDRELAAVVAGFDARAVGALAAVLERAGARRPTEAGRTLVNFVRGFELERLVNPSLDVADFDERLAPLLSALCAEPTPPRKNRKKKR